MGKQKFSNNAKSTLASTIASGDTSLTVQTSHGGRFPTIVGGTGDWFTMTLVSGSTVEIVKCTARSGDVFTIVRGVEGTSAVTWTSGTTIEYRATADAFDQFIQKEGATIAGSESFAVGKSANAANTNSTAVGALSNANGTGSTAVGKSAVVSGDNGVAIGLSAECAASSVAVGRLSSAPSANSISLGDSSVSAGGYSTAIGNASDSKGYGVAIGNAAVSGVNGVAIGSTATQSGTTQRTVVIGASASCTDNDSVAIGYDSSVTGTNAVAVGVGSTAPGSSIAIGSYVTAAAGGICMSPGGTSGNIVNYGGALVGLGGRGCPADAQSWASSTTYLVLSIIRVLISGDYYVYLAATTGTSGASAPTWSTTTGANVTDNTVTWVCLGIVYSSATNNVLIGGAGAVGGNTTAIGDAAVALHGTAIGYNSLALKSSVAIGSYAQVYAEDCVAVGDTALTNSSLSVAIGSGAECQAGASLGVVSIGAYMVNGVAASNKISGISVISKAATGLGSELAYWYSGSESCTLSEEIDLKTVANDVMSITFPSGTLFFPDEIGLIITTASGATAAPDVSFGITGNTTALLVQTAASKLTVGGRNTFSPSSKDGVSSITASVKAAATGTTLKGRFYVKGIFVEAQ